MKFLLALIMMLLAAAAPAYPADPSFAWPGAHHAAIVLTYDDAVPSDLTVVIPQLDRAGLKGTFFLMGKAMRTEDLPKWRAAAASGHELANHTVNHPCYRSTYEMPVPYFSENYTVETLLTEIKTMNILLTAIDGQSKHAFGTPCGHTKVGGQDYIAPLKAAGLASYIRDPVVPAVSSSVPKIVMTGFIGSSAADMIAWVKEVEKSEGVGVIVFHGVGGDYLSVSAEAHKGLLDYLSSHRAEIWTAPYTEAMDYVTQHAH